MENEEGMYKIKKEINEIVFQPLKTIANQSQASHGSINISIYLDPYSECTIL